MRLENFLKSNLVIEGLILLCNSNYITETPESVYNVFKKIGQKTGLKVSKSNSLFDELKKAGVGINNLIRLSTLYSLTDIKDSKTRKELVDDMKNILKKVNKKEIIDFFLRLDKTAFGFTAIPRHILSSLFGIEISSYTKWIDDYNYIKKEINNIKIVLKKMGNTDYELELIEKIESNLLDSLKKKTK